MSFALKGGSPIEIQKGSLYLVGTPIGNLSDCSPRALETLSQVDFIAAEDTRVTRKLLTHFDIHRPLISCFAHNERDRGAEIIRRIQEGESCALVSDAGMPIISDPGESLVARCQQAQIPVSVVPGPTALISALVLSGLPAGRFTFEGFLTVNRKNRRDHLLSLVTEPRTMVFYEAPKKLRRTLRDLLEVLGDRPVTLARELTKRHEEILPTTLSRAEALYRNTEPRGEFVLVVAGAPEPIRQDLSLADAVNLGKALMEKGFSPSEAAKQAVKQSGLKKSDVYRALVLDPPSP